MPTTRQFKSGNSFAVRLPKDIAFEPADAELEITREGDVITLRPRSVDGRKLVELPEIFRSFSKNFMKDGRGDIEQEDRSWRSRGDQP